MAQDNNSGRDTLLCTRICLQWFKTMVQDDDSRQWFKMTMVQDNCSRRDTLFAHLSTCFKTMVQDDGSRRWLKTMVQQVLPSLCTPTCLLMYTFCPSCPGSSYIIAICTAEQSYLRQKNPVCINLNC